jgi:hypothetical protein
MTVDFDPQTFTGGFVRRPMSASHSTRRCCRETQEQ